MTSCGVEAQGNVVTTVLRRAERAVSATTTALPGSDRATKGESVAPLVEPLERLVQIEAEIRSARISVDTSVASLAVDVLGTCGGLFCEVMELGAFSGADHADVRTIVRDAKRDAEYDDLKCWEHRVINVVANHFAPGLSMEEHGDRRVCGAIADALATEIERMKAAVATREQPGTDAEKAAEGPSGCRREAA